MSSIRLDGLAIAIWLGLFTSEVVAQDPTVNLSLELDTVNQT